MGCSETCTLLWVAKHQHLYRARRALCFHGVHHLNMVADPSTHSKRETMVTVCWSWECGAAAHGDVQIIAPGSVVLPSEQELPDHIAQLAATCRLERVSAFRQLQALSNTIRGLGNSRWQGLDDFTLPDDFYIHAVSDNQVRVVRRGLDIRHSLPCGHGHSPARARLAGRCPCLNAGRRRELVGTWPRPRVCRVCRSGVLGSRGRHGPHQVGQVPPDASGTSN